MRISFILSIIVLLTFACAGSGSGESDSTEVLETGKNVFKTYCVLCHGADGKQQLNGAKDLALSILTREETKTVIAEGRNTMAAYEGVLSAEDIEAVTAHVMAFRK